MKVCEKYMALLDLFVDGELPAEEMISVQEHLEGCPGCRAYVDDALVIRAAFPDEEDTVVPEGFADGVLERIRTSEQEKARQTARRRWTGTLAALAACFAVTVLLHSAYIKHGEENLASTFSAGTAATTAEDAAEPAGSGSDMERAGQELDAISGESVEEAASDKEPRAAEARESGDSTGSGMPAEAPMAAAAGTETAEQKKEAALTLTSAEAGELLKDYVPVFDDGVTRCYVLTAEEYEALLKELDRTGQVLEYMNPIKEPIYAEDAATVWVEVILE